MKKTNSRSLSWMDVLDAYDDLYCMDVGLRESATIASAVLLSRKIPGDPLWMFLVGPPSSGKTVIVESFAADKEHCESLSKLTSTALVSGWKDPEDPDREVSIFPLLRDRALLVKDWTAVMSLGGGDQEALYGMLRDAYDGYVRVRYGHGKLVDITDVYFPLLAAVTDAIKGKNRSHLGERFLRCEILGPGHDTEAILDAALDSLVMTEGRKAKIASLGAKISQVQVDTRVDPNSLPSLEPDVREKLKALSLVIGFVRTVVDTDGDELTHRPRPEGGARVAKQLAKLGTSLALLLQKKTVDEDCYQLMKKVGLDTVNGLGLETVQAVMRPGVLWTTDSLRDELRLPKTSLSRRLYGLEQIGILRRHGVTNGKGGGRNSHVWKPHDDFQNLWKRAGLLPSKRRSVV